jgi:hypothetical protein
MQMTGRTVGCLTFAGAPNLESLSVPVGGSAVSGVAIIEVGFSDVSGAKEVYVKKISLTNVS